MSTNGKDKKGRGLIELKLWVTYNSLQHLDTALMYNFILPKIKFNSIARISKVAFGVIEIRNAIQWPNSKKPIEISDSAISSEIITPS